jgi:hypothetical protein
MSFKNESTRCKGPTKKGEPCRAAATPGGVCFFHANPNKASELGRIGGRSKRQVAAEMVDPLPALNNVLVVRDAVARLIADVHARRIDAKIAAGRAPLLNLQLRAFDAVDEMEKRAVHRPYYGWSRATSKHFELRGAGGFERGKARSF